MRQLTMRTMPRRLGPIWVAVPALGGASAALILPGASSTAMAGATLLAVGALALLAGHTWGLVVVLPSHITLVGRLWPALALSGPSQTLGTSDLSTGAIAVVLLTALPALALSAILLPRVIAALVGDKTPRTQALLVAGGALLLVAALILPAL